MLLDAAWILQKFISVGGLLIALCGVAVFGYHFIRGNALAAKTGSGEIPAESWRGAGPRTGLILFGTGVGLAVASVILATQLAG